MSLFIFDGENRSGYPIFFSATNEDGLCPEDYGSVESLEVTAQRKGRTVPDRVFSIGNELIVSKRFYEAISSLRLAAAKTIPVMLSHGGKQLKNYLMLVPPDPIDIIDPERSEVKKFEEYLISVQKWIVDGKKIPDYDLFFAAPNSWFVTDQFIKIYQQNQLAGALFTEVPIV